MKRADGRSPNQLRPITFVPHFTKMAEGSVLAEGSLDQVSANDKVIESYLGR